MYDEIFKLIQNGELNKAQEQLENTPENDPKRYNISGLIYYQKKEFDKAKEEFEKGLKINPVDSDLLFNYGYLLKNINQEKEAWRYLMRIHNKDWATYDLLGDIEYKNRSKLASLRFYKKAAELPNSPNEMKKKFIDMRNIVKQDTKIAFLCLPGLDNFLKDIVETFSLGYDVKLVVTTDGNQIAEAIKWADIVWLEWANDLAVFATNQIPEIQNKKVVCRLHRYEAFTQFPDKINWKNVDFLIFVAESMKKTFHELHPNINLNSCKEEIVYNGVDLDKFKFLVHKPGYNLSVLAHINYRKNPETWVQIIGKLKEIDNRYKLHVGGDFQDPLYKIYFDYIKKEMNLENNFILHGWINEVDKFLEDKDYTLSTSIHEGHPYNILESMARGIKPVILNYSGAKEQWPSELIYNTIDEAVEKITEQTYDSESYRRFIEDNYSLEKQIYEIDQFFFNFSKMNKNVHLTQKNSKKSLLTLGVTNYNSERYINDFLDSVVNQTYKNIELIIVDDCSTDKSPEIIMQYAKKFDFIRLIVHESNKGSPDYGRAEILNLAKGDYLIFFDSDDKFTYPHSLEKMINYIQMNDEIDYVYTDYNIIDENGRNINRWQYKYLTSEEIIVSVFNRKGSGVLPMKGIFKTDFFRKNNINYPINGTSADTLLSLICLKNNMKYDYLNGDLVSYRIHSSNFTINKQKRLDSLIPIIDYLIENFKDIIFTNKSEEEISINLFNYFKNFFYLYELELWKPWGIDYDNFEYININYFKLIEILKKYSSLYDKHKNKYLFLADYIENLYTKKHKPLVSILIPTYNLIDFFKEAFQSALSQTYPNIEIIVSDDSTNSSIEDYMKDFLATYSGDKIVKFFKHENKNGDLGKSNHEFLLNIASGEFISFLHHDDLIHTEKIRLMMHFFILEDNVSLVTSYRKLIDENGNFLNDSVATKRISNNLIIANGLEISRLLFKAGVNFIGEPSTAIFKYQNNKSLSSYKGYEIRALGDYAQWLNSLEKNNFVYIPVALNYTRRHKSQNTHKMVVKSQCLENYFYLLKAFYSDKKN